MLRNTRFTRRDLLKAASAAALGGPLLVGPSARGADATTAPSERITLGFIGVGRMGSRHVSLLGARKDVEVLAICDVREAKREQSRRAVE
jgi:hypothetical protein